MNDNPATKIAASEPAKPAVAPPQPAKTPEGAPLKEPVKTAQ
jgi:hypothetical protein